MRVGVFGGTFNPPHNGHRLIADHAVSALGLDRVLWIPAARSPLKDGDNDIEGFHRLAMCSLVTMDRPDFLVSDLELRRDPPSFMVETLRQLAASADWQLCLLIGQDSWDSFPRWKDPAGIQSLAHVSVYPRAGGDGRWRDEHQFVQDASMAPGTASRLNAPRMEISSTDIRTRLSRAESTAGLIDRRVDAYIRKHGLYGSTRTNQPSETHG